MKVVYKKPADWTNEDIAGFWDWQSKNVSRQYQYFTATMATGIVRFLKKKRLLTGSVLDYGCGTGHLLAQMVNVEKVDFYALDFSADSIAATKARLANKANLKQLELVHTLPTPYTNAQFDTITLIETIEHLQDDSLHATLKELYRLLKKGGKIFITTPFNEDLNRYMNYCPFCHSAFHAMQHMQSFTVESLTTLVTSHGFTVEFCKNTDIEKYKLGKVKYFIKRIMIRLAEQAGVKDTKDNTTPNLVAIITRD